MAETIKYIIKDMLATLPYLPWGIVIGIPIAILVVWMHNIYSARKQKPLINKISVSLFCIYIGLILAITFLSRENGSRIAGADLKLFSTWGINNRNNAYVVENVLLFIPYGFLTAWVFRWGRTLIYGFLFGMVTSIIIECMQLVSGRGFFQLDDIITNSLGMVIGILLFRLCTAIYGLHYKKA